jgi:hypothetical protein
VPDATRPDAARPDASTAEDAARADAAADAGSDTCATAREARAEVERQPVDIIWLVDNSSSMEPAIRQVTEGLNSFAETVADSGIDYRVIMLSKRGRQSGGADLSVCIPEPLAGDGSCGNGSRFFHSSVDIKSTQPLEQFLGTLGQTEGYRQGEERGGEPWADFLRPAATKTIVVVSDDDARGPASCNGSEPDPSGAARVFERFEGGVNPCNRSMLPPGILEDRWDGQFDGYTFHGIYGWGTGDGGRCRFDNGSLPDAAGEAYTRLVDRTGGVRAQICDGASAWDDFFDRVASAVEASAPLACEIPLPEPPDGETLDPTRVNVIVRGAGGETTVGKVEDEGRCGTLGGWFYDDERAPSEVRLCPTSCDLARDRVGGEGTGIFVRFGCETLLI